MHVPWVNRIRDDKVMRGVKKGNVSTAFVFFLISNITNMDFDIIIKVGSEVMPWF